ncbi:hypothetical protein BaRGS_00035823 [Batillaria attramentaria]|uniref:VWFC domain-containing protein n=1 Tax=Batillaria attramentaria TaxID=370345 RepID=A0ABD0JDI8_9CAEN
MQAVLFSVTAVLVFSSVQSTTTPPAGGCQYRGNTYPEGSFRPNPCSPCMCRAGEVHCAIVDCFMPPCVDPQQVEGQCCPVCPNGPNCRAPDGTIVKDGETVEISPGTRCHCVSHGGGGFLAHTQAFCDHTVSGGK